MHWHTLCLRHCKDVAEHNQPRYFTANLAHAYSIDGAAVPLCSATIATHAVQRVSKGILAQNLVQLRQPWPPPMEFACMGNGVESCLLFGFTQGVMVPKPPWPPPHSKGLWVRLSVIFVLSCSVPKCRVTFLHCVSCQECWKHCLQLLINAVPLFPRMLWGPTGFLLCLIIDCKTMLLLSVDTWTWLNGTSTGLERGLTYGSELYNSRTSRGHYKEQWQPILLYVMHLVIIHTNGWLAFFLCSSLFVTARSIGN
jgi:hypothetical protein